MQYFRCLLYWPGLVQLNNRGGSMVARFRSRRKNARKLLAVIGIIAVLVVVIALIFVEARVYGTGFAGKTLWDWLQLLIIPLVLAVAALLFNLATTRTEHKNC